MGGRSTVLFAPETFNLAETTRGIEVARALRERHDCVFAGYSERYAHLIRDAGFRYDALTPVLTDAQADQLLRFDQGRSLGHPFDAATVRARVGSELDVIARTRAQAVVIGTTVTQVLSARVAGVPLVYVKPYAYSAPHVDTLRQIPLLPGSGVVARGVGAAAAWAVRAMAATVTYKPHGLRVVAAERGLRLPRRTLDLLEADLNLVTSLDPYLSGVPLPASYQAVGPVFARLEGEVPTAVTRAVADARAAARPVVYAALGSSGNRALALRVLRALGQTPVTVVAPVRHFLRDGDTDGLSSQVHVCDLLPAHRLAGLVDGAVIHGGEGTVQTAVATATPFVGIGLQAEQRWNIDDCVRQGVAVQVRPRDVGRPAFTRAVHQVVTDPSIRRRAHDLAARVERADGAARAADAISQLLAGRRS